MYLTLKDNIQKQKLYHKHRYYFFLALLLIIFLSLSLGIVHSLILYQKQNNGFIRFKWYYFFSFSKQSIFLLLLTCLFFFYNPDNRVKNILGFCSVTSTLINTLCFRSFIRDWNIYPSTNIFYLNIILYVLEYILIPLFFTCFYLRSSYFNINNYHIGILTFVPVLFYIGQEYLLNCLFHAPKRFFLAKIFINPNDQKHFYIACLKIFLAYSLLTLAIIIFKKIKKYLWAKTFILCFFFFVISTSTLQPQDWAHAKKVIFDNKTMGAAIFPETQEISEYFQNISNLTPEKLKKQNQKILELGSGSGNITQYLIEKFGVENIIAIEIDYYLCQQLHERFPSLKIIQGNAAYFERLLKEEKIETNQIKGIVSTLPVGIFNEQDFQQLNNSIVSVITKNNIKYMHYRFKLFEKKNRILNNLRRVSNFIFISAIIMPVSVYTYSKI
ncbi:rRNA adenine N-6-methyltransferase family protein [Candidatus Phytoplasma melaleucae]|uniref:Dimethyladenosine transferase n=1 Tax=Candidatus Phytoplasma melaleucae TaxID=2982630 RepID=A0ABT9DDX5_9MOLU|nr:rRNA adenine N-6-methyltransferase family protein ['Melaleuca sp.' phytoplasma]MDO8168223.1 hypothetical protein ['Melaleuca sp.' phytoplasma]MDV3205500.1 rRNA adenine N-6-methyltransferase family protein [Weeping tea tree witches'-broom phytoplasma]